MTLSPSGKRWFVVGTALAGLTVVLGAFGAHGVEAVFEKSFDANHAHAAALEIKDSAAAADAETRKALLEKAKHEYVQKRMKNWDTAARYQMYHALGLLGLGLVFSETRKKSFNMAGALFVFGVLLFSGCLYGWCLTDIKVLVLIVPLGGLSFILGWCVLGFAVWKDPAS